MYPFSAFLFSIQRGCFFMGLYYLHKKIKKKKKSFCAVHTKQKSKKGIFLLTFLIPPTSYISHIPRQLLLSLFVDSDNLCIPVVLTYHYFVVLICVIFIILQLFPYYCAALRFEKNKNIKTNKNHKLKHVVTTQNMHSNHLLNSIFFDFVNKTL